jgi:NitT/TauT family transport system ATP-binding protein
LMRGAGYVTQEDNLLPWRTAIGNVEYGLQLQRVPPKERRKRAQEFLARVGLAGFENHYPHQLSGGMRKRVSIGRTLVLDPSVILMDEPFGPLDAQTRIVLQNDLLTLWRGTGKTIVFVTHDLVEAIALSDRVVVMTKRPGTIKSVHRVPLSRPRNVFHIHAAPGFAETYDRIWSELRSEIQEPAVGAPA